MSNTSNRYDLSGNVTTNAVEYTGSGRAIASSVFDALNRETVRTDALGHSFWTMFDPLGRIVAVDGDRYPLRADYDTAGRKTHGFTTRDGGATWDETQWEFDPASGVNTAKEYADGSRVAYSYTDNGKKTRTTWARGVWKQHAYNVRNLVSGTTYSGTATPSVAYTYADSGKTASATLSDGTSYAYGYDDRLLNTNESVTVGGDAFSVNRTFDAFRRAQETAVVVTNVRHSAKIRLYDSEDRVCGYALTNAAGRGVSVSLAYDGSYVTNTVYTLPNGSIFSARLSREAGRRNLVTRRDYFFGGQSIYWYSTEYDLLNRPTNATDSVSLVREWLYNRRSELAAATVGADSYGYTYDSIGNRLWSAANAVTNSYTANSLNQYTAVSSGANPVYDADGNMTGDGTFAYAYDAENRLVLVTSAAETNGAIRVLNAYDHRNRRIRKTVQRLNSSIAPPPSPPVGMHEWETQETHTFVWDGNNIVLEKVEFADGTTRTFEYFWGADKSGTEQGAGGVEGLLAVSMDGVFYIPCYDHNGNIIVYVSETGSIAAQYTYDPYGNIIESSGPLADVFSFGFSTQYHDRDTGMVGYKRRFYRPDLGRWLNRDPIEEEGGENLYAFCRNNAIIYYDPNGESFEDVSNFCAGVGDSLSFGITQLFRRGLNRMIEGTWDDPADVESSAYTAGEVTEVTVEIAVTLGGATLRHTAKAVSRRAVEGSARSAYRRAHNLVGKGGEVHHINPIKGHPNGSKARYPLPYEWAARSEWNLTWYATRAEHQAAHAQMQLFETIDKYRESTMITRQAVNMMINYLNTSSETKCWDSLDVQTSIFYMEYESYGTNLNAVPESVSIQVQ